MVAAVATLDPDTAAKTEQEAILVCIKPPGKKLSQPPNDVYNRSVIPLRSNISPIRINKGTATRTKLVLGVHARSPIAIYKGRSENINPRINPREPSVAPI